MSTRDACLRPSAGVLGVFKRADLSGLSSHRAARHRLQPAAGDRLGAASLLSSDGLTRKGIHVLLGAPTSSSAILWSAISATKKIPAGPV